MVKQDQQSHPNVPTNPDRSCTYLVLRAHRMGKTLGWHRPWLPRGRRTSLRLDQCLEKHWPGGVNKYDPWDARLPREKARWQMVKPRLGLAGGVLFKANCQGVPIITQPRKERKIREHNTDMTETRAARVEQNTRHKAESSPFTKYIDALIKIRDIVISQHNHVPTWSNLQLHLQLATL